MPSLEKAIKELFVGSKYIIDYERNIVVARGTPEQLNVMEKIITEFSYKHTLDGFIALAGTAGFRFSHVWTDPKKLFAVFHLVVAD